MSDNAEGSSTPSGIDADRIAEKIVRELRKAISNGDTGSMEVVIDVEEAMKSPNRSRIQICRPTILAL